MNSIKNTKRDYQSPSIEMIVLDNEISLVLQSDVNPTSDPDWLIGRNELNKPDPFRANNV